MLSDIKLFYFLPQILYFFIPQFKSSHNQGGYSPPLCDFKGRVTLYLFALEPLLQGKPIISQFVY